MISIAAFVIFYIGSVVEYQELKNQVYILTLAFKIKNNLVDVPLISENKEKIFNKNEFRYNVSTLPNIQFSYPGQFHYANSGDIPVTIS